MLKGIIKYHVSLSATSRDLVRSRFWIRDLNRYLANPV
jgi:hypothetical protein